MLEAPLTIVGGLLMKQPTHSFICLLLSLAYCFYLPVTRRGRSRVRGQYIWPRPLSLVGEFGFVAFAVIVEGDDNVPAPHGGDVAGPVARAVLEAGLQ